MRYITVLLLFLASSALADQTFFKCKTDKGTTLYSDAPCPGATRMEVSTTANIVPAVKKEPVLAENAPSYGYFPQNTEAKGVTGYSYSYKWGQINSPEPIPGWFLYNLVESGRQNGYYGRQNDYFGLRNRNFNRR